MSLARAADPARAFRRRRLAKRLLVVAGLVAGASLVAWAILLRPVAARPHRVQRGDVVVTVYGRGTLEGRREAQLGFDLVGRLSSVLVDEGEQVWLGQELARLAPDQYTADLGTALSGVASSNAALRRLAVDETRAREALRFAETEERRGRALVQQGALPTADLDASVDRTRLARAELDRVLAQRQEATRAIEVAAGGVKQRQATVVRATLLAPFDGMITRRLKEPGDTLGVGTTVLRVADKARPLVVAAVDESALPRLAEGQPVQVTVPGDDRRFAGVVERIGLEVDRQTHELPVEIGLEEVPARYALGQRADVWIQVGRARDVVSVPSSFVRRDAAGPFCYLAREGRIARTPVTLGVIGSDRIEIVAGLAADDLVLDAADPGDALPVGRRFVAGP